MRVALPAIVSVLVLMLLVGLIPLAWYVDILPVGFGLLPRMKTWKGKPGKLILLASNHRTGSSLSEKIAATLAKAASEYNPRNKIELLTTPFSENFSANGSDLTLALNPHCGSLPSCHHPYCLVHFVRNPINIAVSAYIYHLRLGATRPVCGGHLCEAWLFQPTRKCRWIAGNGVSLYDKLRLASEQSDVEGLRCQLRSSRDAIKPMVRCFTEAKRKKHGVLQIDLDSVAGQIDRVLARIHETCGLEDVVPLAKWLDESASLVPNPQELHSNNNKAKEKALRDMASKLDFDFRVNLTELYAFLNQTAEP